MKKPCLAGPGRLQKTAGIALPSAIFLLVVMALLAAFMLRLVGNQHAGAAADVQGTRAYWAARAGIEWGAAQVRVAAPPFVACPAAATFTVEGFTVTVDCASSDHVEGSDTRRIYRFTSIATAGGTPGAIGYVERQVSAFVEY